MKLLFVVPGDQLELLEDTKFVDTGWSEVKMEAIPKGTILEVSQVYIRNHGYYQSNISFKFADGPGYDLFVQSENSRKFQELKDHHARLLKEIKDLDAHDADFTYTENNRHPARLAGLLKPYLPSQPIYKKATFDEYAAFTKAREASGRYISYTGHKTMLLEMLIKVHFAILNFKPKVRVSKNFCRVIRVPLPEIEKWEIKLLHRIPKQNQ